MVVRIPIPGTADTPAPSSSLPTGSTPSTSSPGLSHRRLPGAIQGPSPESYQDVELNLSHDDGLPQTLNTGPSPIERLYDQDDGAAEKKLPMLPQADRSIVRLEKLHAEPPDISVLGSSAAGKDTPRSSLESQRSADFWELITQGNSVSDGKGQLQQASPLENTPASTFEPTASSALPNAQVPDRQNLASPSIIIGSNNPFRRENSNQGCTAARGHTSDGCILKQEPKDDPDVGSSEIAIKMTANLTLDDRPFSEYSSSYRPSTLAFDAAFPRKEPEQILPQMPPSSLPIENSTPPPLVSPGDGSIDHHQSSLIPVPTDESTSPGPAPLHPGSSKGFNCPMQDSNARRRKFPSIVVADVAKELPSAPQTDKPSSAGIHASAAHSWANSNLHRTSSQGVPSQRLHLQEHAPPSPPRPQRSLGITTDAEIARLREQRTETYQIKHFNWLDYNSRTMRRSSMLTQNKNGPCPLLALVNALILRVDDDSRSALGAALRTREQVSLGLIIESLVDELTSEGRGGQLAELPDVDELNRFLLLLHTGMTANPILAAPAPPSASSMDAKKSSMHLPVTLNDDRKPGAFEDTPEMRLYGAFGVPLVHGWLAPRSDPARGAFARSAATYEDAQTILFREEELEDKLSRVGMTTEEQQLLQDISSIKAFLESHPTQLTPYGLDIIHESLYPGAFAILFRNDHFSTIYKHPEGGQLFTLVTDAGYSDKDEVIWESLVDVSGQDGQFFSGDFRPVGNVEAAYQPHGSQGSGSHGTRAAHITTQSHTLESETSSQEEQQQQADADFALALQLQEEEEAGMDDSRRRSGANDGIPARNSIMNNTHRQRDHDDIRPIIPPRNPRGQAVNRPVDPDSDEAPPPAYEEAAKGKPYLPPMGHPQHPSFNGRSPTSGPSTPLSAHGPRTRLGPSRRVSAFQETSQFQNSSPLTRSYTNSSVGVAQSDGRPRDRDKDCLVM